ncbi:MAG: alpha/beta hydrolase [Gemmatimonadetes bacterium]|nr:alpha/beta hydrolase [Gemmatimonadota bacterium]
MGLRLNEFEIEWRESGSGDVVLFVHAFPLHSAMWGQQLAAMPPGWRGIAPDLRGFGSSEFVIADAYTMDMMADDLAELLDRLHIERAVVCGLSMGGYIALSFWRRHADRVRALILCDTRAGADSPEAAQARRELAQEVLTTGHAAVVETLLPRLLAPATHRKNRGAVTMVRAMMEEASPHTIARALLGIAQRADAEPLLRTIDVPVLAVCGDDDVIAGRGQAEILARGIRGARLEIIPGAGHLPNLEEPEEFNALLHQFLAGLPKDAVYVRTVERVTTSGLGPGET